jgi:hypothetical protein
MAIYSVHIIFNGLGFMKNIEAENLDSANLIATDLAVQEFGDNLEGIIYNISETIDSGIIMLEDLNG